MGRRRREKSEVRGREGERREEKGSEVKVMDVNEEKGRGVKEGNGREGK